MKTKSSVTVLLEACAAEKTITEKGHVVINKDTLAFASKEIAVQTLDDVRVAVKAMGSAIRSEKPKGSFTINIKSPKGLRTTKSFRAALKDNGMGQEDFMTVVDHRPKPQETKAEPAPPAAA